MTNQSTQPQPHNCHNATQSQPHIKMLQELPKSDQNPLKIRHSKQVEQILAKISYNSFVEGLSSNLSSYSNSSKSTHFSDYQQEGYLDGLGLSRKEEFFCGNFTNTGGIVDKPIYDLDETKPAFIQHFSKLNSIMPNYHYSFFTIEHQMPKLAELLEAAHKALLVVKENAEILAARERMAESVKKLGLKFVAKSTCDTCKQKESLDRLKPRANFKAQTFTLENLREKLDLVETKITRYQIVLSLTPKIQLSLYLRIREVLLQIQQQLLKYSASIYMQQLHNNPYPNFCYAYIQLITDQPVPQK